jgi:hypothetical protein
MIFVILNSLYGKEGGTNGPGVVTHQDRQPSGEFSPGWAEEGESGSIESIPSAANRPVAKIKPHRSGSSGIPSSCGRVMGDTRFLVADVSASLVRPPQTRRSGNNRFSLLAHSWKADSSLVAWSITLFIFLFSAAATRAADAPSAANCLRRSFSSSVQRWLIGCMRSSCAATKENSPNPSSGVKAVPAAGPIWGSAALHITPSHCHLFPQQGDAFK